MTCLLTSIAIPLKWTAGAMMASYPPTEWSMLSSEGKAFMRQLKEFFGNVSYEGEQGPEGVLVFPEREWEGKGYWSCEF